MAPYPIKHGARAIWRASQSSDWPTSKMYRLYAVQAIHIEISTYVEFIKKHDLLTDSFGCIFHPLLGKAKRGTVVDVQCHFPLDVEDNLGRLE